MGILSNRILWISPITSWEWLPIRPNAVLQAHLFLYTCPGISQELFEASDHQLLQLWAETQPSSLNYSSQVLATAVESLIRLHVTPLYICHFISFLVTVVWWRDNTNKTTLKYYKQTNKQTFYHGLAHSFRGLSSWQKGDRYGIGVIAENFISSSTDSSSLSLSLSWWMQN